MAGVQIGWVAHYIGGQHVAVLALSDTIRVGDWLRIVGYVSDFIQPVEALEIDHRSAPEAGPGQQVTLKLKDRAHVNDIVYRLTIEEMNELASRLTFSHAG